MSKDGVFSRSMHRRNKIDHDLDIYLNFFKSALKTSWSLLKKGFTNRNHKSAFKLEYQLEKAYPKL